MGKGLGLELSHVTILCSIQPFAPSPAIPKAALGASPIAPQPPGVGDAGKGPLGAAQDGEVPQANFVLQKCHRWAPSHPRVGSFGGRTGVFIELDAASLT